MRSWLVSHSLGSLITDGARNFYEGQSVSFLSFNHQFDFLRYFTSKSLLTVERGSLGAGCGFAPGRKQQNFVVCVLK